jgi:hypothetical protein
LLRRIWMRPRTRRLGALGGVVVVLLLWGCSVNEHGTGAIDGSDGSGQGDATSRVSETIVADVVSVQVTGGPDSYQFSVGVSSPDEGCDQYADWWEIITEEGGLIYRRILTHSHVDEQPFVRSGGPVVIQTDTVVFLRAHMHPGGYGGSVMRGTVGGSFEVVEVDVGFASELQDEPPQPTGCAF